MNFMAIPTTMASFYAQLVFFLIEGVFDCGLVGTSMIETTCFFKTPICCSGDLGSPKK